jgi:outer membrane protein OmpA-like peptidoglycan-associated protein
MGLALGAPAAGDLWQGFYIGANVGGGFGSSTTNNNINGLSVTRSRLDMSGPVGGIQGGYNWRLNPSWVLGLETDFDGSGLTSHSGQSVTAGPLGSTITSSVSRDLEWLGTVRGRVGYNLSPTWLYFITGGFAYGQVNASAAANATLGAASVNFVGRRDGIQTGWTVGTGSEIAIAPRFGLQFQYTYTDLGNFTLNAPAISATAAGAALVGAARNNISVDNTSHIFRVGLNYHFNAPPPPPAPMAAPAPPPAPPKVFIVFFDWDKDTVTPEGQAIIAQAADAYKAGAPVQIQVTGYTDRSGSPGYNQRLSERRANNVAKALAALGVPKTQMIVSGRGENDNRVPTADGVREPQNRRVEIVSP